MSNSMYKQWAIHDDGIYYPSQSTTNALPAGVYEIRKTPREAYFLKKLNIVTEGILEIPMVEMEDILTDVKTFWEKADTYHQSKMIHKRGILLFGRPGSGKSVIIQRLIKHIIEVKDGIVINISSSNCVENYFTFAPEILRVIEPDRPLLVILEELDQLIYRSHIDIPAMLLNLLDGIKQIGNVIYMATTNHPERLDAHFTNRPGRFDVKKRLGLLTEEGREYFLRHKLTVDEIAKIDFKKWVTDSEGLSIAHLKELIVSVLIIGKDYEKTIESLKRMKDFKSSREDNVSEVGF